jgi:hypothetical protein
MHWLTDCTLLSEIFATEIIELKSSDHSQYRLVNMRGHKFTEKIIHQCGSKLVYQIEGNGPIKNHKGEIQYIRSSDEHYLHYQVHGQSNTWVPSWVLRMVMCYDFTLAAKRLRKSINDR